MRGLSNKVALHFTYDGWEGWEKAQDRELQTPPHEDRKLNTCRQGLLAHACCTQAGRSNSKAENINHAPHSDCRFYLTGDLISCMLQMFSNIFADFAADNAGSAKITLRLAFSNNKSTDVLLMLNNVLFRKERKSGDTNILSRTTFGKRFLLFLRETGRFLPTRPLPRYAWAPLVNIENKPGSPTAFERNPFKIYPGYFRQFGRKGSQRIFRAQAYCLPRRAARRLLITLTAGALLRLYCYFTRHVVSALRESLKYRV